MSTLKKNDLLFVCDHCFGVFTQFGVESKQDIFSTEGESVPGLHICNKCAKEDTSYLPLNKDEFGGQSQSTLS